MRIAGVATFRRYLNDPTDALTPWQVARAGVHTWRYYSQRRRLCTTHCLRPYHLPWLYVLQWRTDWTQRETVRWTKARLARDWRRDGVIRDCTEVQVRAPDRVEMLRERYPAAGFRPMSAVKEFWRAVYVTEGPLPDRFQSTLQNIFSYLKSLRYVDTVAQWIVTYLNLYHEALQQLIEGHREVTQDHSTKLDSGKTVSETLSAFEQSITEHMPKYQAALKAHIHKTGSK